MSEEVVDRTIVLMRINSISSTQTVSHASRILDQITEQQYKARAIRRLIWKLDLRLLPLLVLLQISSFIDRASIGHVKEMGIHNDMQMSPEDQYWFVSIFFLAYIIFGIPSNIFLRVIGPTRYLSLSVIAWGSLTVSMSFIKTVRALFIVRFFLGMFVAGFYPSMIIYFSLWYCKRHQIMRITILHTASIVACTFNSLLAQGITLLDNIAGFNNWQWIYIFEGVPNIALGIIIYIFLGSLPDTVQWLTNSEKELLTNLLLEDKGIDSSEFKSGTRFSWVQVGRTFTDWRIYLYVTIGFCSFGVNKFITTFLPSLLKGMGQYEGTIHLMTAPVYALASVFCLIVGYSSSRQQEISFHLIFCQLVALMGFILLLTLFNHSATILFISMCIVCCGVLAACPLVMSWVVKNIGGHTKRTIAVGLVLSIGESPGIIVPQVYRDADQPTYRQGHIICIVLLIIGVITTLILRYSLKRENRRRENLSINQYNCEAAAKEPCDRHPDMQYSY